MADSRVRIRAAVALRGHRRYRGTVGSLEHAGCHDVGERLVVVAEDPQEYVEGVLAERGARVGDPILGSGQLDARTLDPEGAVIGVGDLAEVMTIDQLGIVGTHTPPTWSPEPCRGWSDRMFLLIDEAVASLRLDDSLTPFDGQVGYAACAEATQSALGQIQVTGRAT